MSNAIVVLNTGSSSIKFSAFVECGENLEPSVRGQVEGLYTSARFISKAPDGSVKVEKAWPENAKVVVHTWQCEKGYREGQPR